MSTNGEDCRKAVEAYLQQLRTSRECFHAIVTRSADGVLVLDEHGMICFVNPAAEALLDRPMEHLLGATFGVPIHGEGTTEVELVRQGGATTVAELHVVETIWQERPAYLATLRDITGHKQAQRRADDALRRRDAFIAMLSHELRNPLAAIGHAARFLAKDSLTAAELHRTRDTIERQCRQMTRLLGDLFDVSQITRGKLRVEWAPLDFRQVAADVVDALSPMIREHRHELAVSLPPGPLPVLGDRARLVQVVSNLLTNAARYTPEGGHIALFVRTDGDHLELVVADDGIGIDPALQKAVFEPFVQVAAPPGQGETGLGIGLPLVRSLVQLHHGTAELVSPGPGQGTVVTVRLPLAETNVLTLPRASGTPGGAEPTRTTDPLRILLVEDNPDIRDLLKQLLELDGHIVQTACDGGEALELAAVQAPELALVDIGLPVLDGYGVARRMRELPGCGDTYLVALSGYGQSEDRRAARSAGFDRHLVKPVEFGVLKRLLSDVAARLRMPVPVGS